jgi:hypothetical protein
MTTQTNYTYELIDREADSFSDYDDDENSDCGSNVERDLSNDGSDQEFLEEAEENKPQWYHHILSEEDEEYIAGVESVGKRTISIPYPFGGSGRRAESFDQLCVAELRKIEYETACFDTLTTLNKETAIKKKEYAKKEAERVVPTPVAPKRKKSIKKADADEVLYAARKKKDEEKKKAAAALKRRERKDKLAEAKLTAVENDEEISSSIDIPELDHSESVLIAMADATEDQDDEYVPVRLPKTPMVFNSPKTTVKSKQGSGDAWTVVGVKTKKEKAKPFIPLITEAPNIVRGTIFTLAAPIPRPANLGPVPIRAKSRTFVPKPCSFEICGKVRRGTNGKYTNKTTTVCFYLHALETLENYYERTEGLCRYGSKCGKIKCLPNQTYWNRCKDDVCRLSHPNERLVNLEMRLMMTPLARSCGFGSKCFKTVMMTEGVYHSVGGHVCKFLHPNETNASFRTRVGIL